MWYDTKQEDCKIKRFYKINQYITAEKVRLVDEKGNQIGVIPLQEAFFKSRQKGLDLVEVAPEAKPPVVKIIDFKKFLYQEKKKEKLGKKKTVKQDTKEIRFTPFIAKNDYDIRIQRAKDFLIEGNRVKLTVRFLGRQITRKQFGYQLLNKAIEALASEGQMDGEAKWQGRTLIASLNPIKKTEKNPPKADQPLTENA